MQLETVLLIWELLQMPDPGMVGQQDAGMKLNHIDLQVSDIHEARAFFEVNFGLRCSYTRGGQIALLEDESGFSLGVSKSNATNVPVYPPDFHVGFALEDAEKVKATYGRLKEAGVPMKYELREGGPNRYFVCFGPDGIPVEVSAPREVPTQ